MSDAIRAFEETPSPMTAFSAIVEAVTHPQRTFEELPLKGPLGPAVVLALLLGMLVWADQVSSLSSSVDWLLSMPQFREVAQMPAVRGYIESFHSQGTWFAIWLGGLPNVPAELFGLFLTVHVPLMMVSAAGGGWRQSARVVCYTSTGAALTIVPVIGSLLALILVSIQIVAGLKHVHQTTTTRVVIGLSLPLVFVLLLVIGFGALMLALLHR